MDVRRICPFVGYLYGIVKYLVKTLDSHQGHETVRARCKFRVSMYVQVIGKPAQEK
jgi:hypothetical protein